MLLRFWLGFFCLFLAEILGGFLLGFLAVLAVCFTGLLKVGCRMLKVGFCWDFWLCFTGYVGWVFAGLLKVERERERERERTEMVERENEGEREIQLKYFFKFLINYFLGLINYFSF